MIEATNLTKRYGAHTVVDGLSFRVQEGAVTGFLGPNGSGKSTTMRMMLGLDHPTAGRVTVGERPYRDLRRPLRAVGALLDAGQMHGGRSAREHLRMLARSNAIGPRRVEEVLEQVGLATVADRRVRGFSLGMRQRLGIAAALLGDPGVLILDEPMNGLDTEGIRWLRALLAARAAAGNTVLLAGHVMSEIASCAEHLLVIGGGRLLADEPLTRFLERNSPPTVRVRAVSEVERLRGALEIFGGRVEVEGDGLVVHGLTGSEVGGVAAECGVALSESTTVRASLEDAYTALVAPHERFRAVA